MLEACGSTLSDLFIYFKMYAMFQNGNSNICYYVIIVTGLLRAFSDLFCILFQLGSVELVILLNVTLFF